VFTRAGVTRVLDYAFGLVVASNLFGDILSDRAAAVAGSIGIAPAGNLNPEREFPSMFEPVHDSAPDTDAPASTCPPRDAPRAANDGRCPTG
jgi:isocitrate dehydrogenase